MGTTFVQVLRPRGAIAAMHRRKRTRFSTVVFLAIPAICFTFVFSYVPLVGLIVSFKDYDIWKGFFRSPWTSEHGFKHILDIVRLGYLNSSIVNTLILSVLNMLIGFPAPIILALLFNELANGAFKKSVQTISYMPYFLSWISVIGLCYSFFAEYGPLNDIMNLLFGAGRQRVLYLARQRSFVPLLLILNLWKTIGWSSIIYLAAISGIDPQLYEASAIDGASRPQQIRHVTIPGIAPTAVILLILSIGGILGSNFELVFGLQNVYIDFETIDTLIYKHGLLQRGYSQATALGFTRGMVALVLTLIANFIARRLRQSSVF